ncbi:cation:proton antiporter [Candidatus Woesearchaeota archaeon]|nr:cation:proton antiporter [Candidatus Woesearchaeota archaeon]
MVVAAVFALLARVIRQPLIPAYIFAGLVIGPVLGLITSTHVITTLSEIGIAFLLFVAGLEIDINRLRNVGFVSTLGGTIQVLTIFTLAFILALMLGFLSIEAIYVGLIIAFSSTMVVVKLLSDKRELDTLHGRIMLGILLMQDIIAILALSMLTTVNGFSGTLLGLSLLKGASLFVVAWLTSRYVFPQVFKFAAKSRELLFLLSIAVVFAFAALFNAINFSIAIGAFVAGVTLGNLTYNIEIISIVRSLRDFFATIFFVSLGMELLLDPLRSMIAPLIIFVLIVVLVKPLVTMFVCAFFGYKRRPSFIASTSLAQVSEFSLIIVAQGLTLGHIGRNMLSFAVLLAIITITLTSYLSTYEDFLFKKLSRYLKPFDRFSEEGGEALEYIPKKRRKQHFILLGHNRIGYSISRTLRKMKKELLIVDYNPEVIKRLIREKIPCIYGDVGDIEILERLNLKYAYMIVSTVPDKADSLLLIKKTRLVNKRAIIIVTASQLEDALKLYDTGADYVIMPHFLGGEHVSVMIEDFTGNVNKMIETKVKHIEELRHRQNLGHEHPKHH